MFLTHIGNAQCKSSLVPVFAVRTFRLHQRLSSVFLLVISFVFSVSIPHYLVFGLIKEAPTKQKKKKIGCQLGCRIQQEHVLQELPLHATIPTL